MMLIFCLLIAATIVGIPIFLLIFEMKRCWFNKRHYDDARDEIFLSFKDFMDFYNLNPDRYEISYEYDNDVCSLNIKEESGLYDVFTRYKIVDYRNKYKIKFKLFSFIRFYYWFKHKQKVKKKQKYNEDMYGMLKLVQKDIDSIREQAEKKVREAERVTNEVGGRL